MKRWEGNEIYTLLIVDDEALVRRAVSSIIDWDSLGFTTIYQAEDGLEALEIVRKHKVDLVLTDIVMPFMDGLELSKALSEEFPDIHVVILTGHEDFEYAKQSVDLGVKNYILKPVGASTLYSKMTEICKKLNIEATQKQYISRMRAQLYQSMPILRERILNSIVCAQYGNKNEMLERAKSLDVELENTWHAIAIVDADLSQVVNNDVELYNFAAKNITFDCVGENHYIFEDNHNEVVIIFCCDPEEEDSHFIVYNTLQVIQKAIYTTLKVDVTCAMGSVVENVEDLYYSYKEARTALDCKYSLGENSVYDINDLNYIEKSFYYPVDVVKDFINSIKFLGEKEIAQSLGKIYEEILKNKALSSSNIKMIFIEITTSLLKELSGVKKVSDTTWKEGFAFFNQLEKMNSPEKVLENLYIFAMRVSNELKRLQSSSSQSVIDEVKTYVEKNYANEDISLSTAAEAVSVSTGYLSALFKKETGINFVKYLTDVRMEKSMELLKMTDKKTYEIAYETGFANPHYFSISFKKYTGMSPSDFRIAQEPK